MRAETAFRLAAEGEAAAEARRTISKELGDHLGTDELADLHLLVTELVSNSVRHAGLSDGDEIEVRIEVGEDRIRVDVANGGPGFDPDAVSRDEVQQGLGLQLLVRLAADWGTYRDALWHVWFELVR